MIKLNNKMKLKDFINYYNEEVAKIRWSVTTIAKCNSIVEKRIIPYLGDIRLCNLNEDVLKRFLLNQINSQTIFEYQNNHQIKMSYYKRVRTILSSIISSAVEMHLIKENYLKQIKINLSNYINNTSNSSYWRDETKIHFFDKDTYIKVIGLLKQVSIEKRAIIEIALKCGLRKSEIFGLKWEDIDFKNKTINIYKSRQYIKGIGMVLKSTKNKSSIRKIVIGDSLINVLKTYRESKNNFEDEFLFDNVNFLSISEWFKRWQKQNNIVPVIRFHDLRHTHASLLLLQGVDFKTISSRLGHSSIVTTMNIYAHVIESLDKDAAQKIDELEYKKD